MDHRFPQLVPQEQLQYQTRYLPSLPWGELIGFSVLLLMLLRL